MEKEKKMELLKHLMTRFDGLISTVNTKAGFYVVLSTFIISTCVTGYINWADRLQLNWFYKGVIILCVVASLLCIFLIALAVNPNLKTGNGKDYKSLLFFGPIRQMKESEFEKAFMEANEDTLMHDYSVQVYTLSELLCFKYAMLKWTSWIITCEFIALGILMISKIITF